MAGLMLALLAAAPSASIDPVEQWRPMIAEASARHGVPADWIARVMRAESGGRTVWNGAPIRSRAGAIGLMQLMPATWVDMRAADGLGANPDDPRDNVMAGTTYLRLLYDRFGYPGLFAAYNAGPARYADVLAGRARLPVETLHYVDMVTGAAAVARRTPLPPAPPTLFVVRHDADGAASPSSLRSRSASIFALDATSR
jgi:soluble lytic murein transglycosylase-like protein